MREGRALRSTRRLSNQAWSRPAWYKIANSALAGPTEVTIYDEIGFFGVSPSQFMDDLDGIPGDIVMHINSPGGDIFDGITIYNRLKQRQGTIDVIIDGLAASAASFIAMAASPGRLAMAPRSDMMIHNGFTMAIGDADDLRKTADLLDKKTRDIASVYAERTGKPLDYWLAQMKQETWYGADEAVAEGLADHVLGQEKPSNKWDLSVYLNPPAVVNADGNHAPMTGTHSHSHPAYGAQGADGTHSHEHFHDGDADHGHSHDPDNDGDDDSTAAGDTDQDYAGKPKTAAAAHWHPHLSNADKYKQADRDKMAKSGEAMPDGSYPIADAEDLDNAIRAVGRGGADHDTIRAHIIKRAAALGLSSRIPDNWNSDGSLKDLSDTEILAMFARELDQLDAGREQ